MNKRIAIFIVIFIILSIIIDISFLKLSPPKAIGSAKETVGLSDNKNSNQPVNLTLWCYYEGAEWDAIEYHEKHPNVNVRVEVFPYNELIDKALETISSGEGPDMIILESGLIGDINGTEALQNLLEKPFSAGKYQKDFDEDIWRMALSLDKKRLIGIPMSANPMFTYYRADIMEQYGFPSEAGALAEYMKDSENWLKIAQTLKKDNKFISSWPTDPLEIYESATGVFDEKLNFLRMNSDFEMALKLSENVKMNGLSLNGDIYNESGKEAVRDSRLVMFYGGSWISSELKSLVPMQKGDWRITTLPFAKMGWNSANIISISSASKNKEEAWRFIQTFEMNENQVAYQGSLPVYLPAKRKIEDFSYRDVFFGGQDVGLIYKNVTEAMHIPLITPLDRMTNEIWDSKVQGGIGNFQSPDEILKQFRAEFNLRLGDYRNILLKSLVKN